MLLRFFKSNLPYVIVFIPVFGALLWLPSLYPELSAKHIEISSQQTPFFEWISQLLQANYYLNISSALTICVLQAYLLIRLNFKYIFINNKTYLPAVIFVLLSSSIVALQNLNAALVANLFVLFAIDKCFPITKERNRFKSYYESGFFIGLATLIYPIAIYYLIIIWLTQLVLRTFNWREWMSSIIGLITPIVFAWAISFLQSDASSAFNAYIDFFTTDNYLNQSFNKLNLIALISSIIIFVIALLSSLRLIGTKKISSRKYFSLFIWIILLTIAVFVMVPCANLELIYFVAVPMSFILAMFFMEMRKNWIAELFFTLLIAGIIILLWF